MTRISMGIFTVLLSLSGLTSPILAQTQPGMTYSSRKVEKVRVEFRELLIQNPNYFGNVIDESLAAKYQPVYIMHGNTKYEELVCVGLYPEDNLLEAIIVVKKPYGYKSGLCGDGSTEYVAFYIDYNDGNGFVSVGAPAKVNVHDISFVNGGRLYYAVRKPFIPKYYKKCETPQIVKVRAILSWERLPQGPGFKPVWGNTKDVWVQIQPKKTWAAILPPFVTEYTGVIPYPKTLPEEEVKQIGPIPPEKFVIMGNKEQIKELIDRSIAAEEKTIRADTVEKERSEFRRLISQNPNYFGAITKSKDINEIMKEVYKLPMATAEYLLPALEANPALLIPAFPYFSLKTKYEELRCVGLYPERDLLEAVIEVKLPTGFLGDLCTIGSVEYVAFYIDYGDGGGYQHVATRRVRVHDIPEVSNKHLFYAVKARIQNVESRLKDCSVENIIRVKAILSWNQDPTPFGHTFTPTWGNLLTRNIQLRPTGGKADIEIVNEIHADDISKTGTERGLAIKVNDANNTIPGIYDRPFGGIIACWGNVNISNAKYYRFSYKEDTPGATWNIITDKRIARDNMGYVKYREPDQDGWFSITEYNTDVANYSLVALVHWRSYGKNGNYVLKLEVSRADKVAFSEDVVPLLLDNTTLELLEFSGTPTPLPAWGVVVKDKLGNYRKCASFKGSEEIQIFGNFRDDYFNSFNLTVFGGNITASGVHIGKGRYDTGVQSNPPLSGNIGNTGITGALSGMSGHGQQIGTLDLCTIDQNPKQVKCAYGIHLYIQDRAIVGYTSGYQFNTKHHWRRAFVTFDWDPKGCPK